MPAENKSSKSTDRSKRNAGKRKNPQAVRQHSKKAAVSPLKASGDIISLTRNDRVSVAVGTSSLVVIDYPFSADLIDEFGANVISMKARFGWTNPLHNKMVCDYVKSLCCGDGTVPIGLSASTVRSLQRSFMDFCDRRGIRYTVRELTAAG